ncbi:indolepyruvate ferredoxin oxidoreductase family protein [Microbaculum marinum]|uniref:Indolepyruvate ferredoxin oxidoreductase family protein n=1 Tax=Microbaculum marinum TaxID=1764581 RepID=A0AAW9S0D0_9HYPH
MNAIVREATLDDKYVRERGPVYMTGIQALVRLPLDQIRRDRIAGLKTGGYISGYRGSPLAGYDQQLERAQRFLDSHDLVFHPGLNEELAATAVWGTQKVGIAGRTDYDGVFGIWYGKAPGVDRAGDVLRHANASGTAAAGGVLAIAGDDHLAKSSSLPVQSEQAFIHSEIPILNPSDLQDVLDYGLHGIAMSRYSGLWVALIALADTMDSSGIVNVDPNRLTIRRPLDHEDPRKAAELNTALTLATRHQTEVLTRTLRLPAAKAYARANRLDRKVFGAERPRFGIVTTGKAYRDLRQTLELMGITEAVARDIGLAVYKVAMPWPLEPEAISAFARGLDRLLVVEHKRAVIEPQLKELMFHWSAGERPEIWGKLQPSGRELLPEVRECGPAEIAPALLEFLPKDAQRPQMEEGARRLETRQSWGGAHGTDAQRTPYFCSGCPHSTSTVTPEGSRSMPGIGCHAMTEVSGRTTEGLIAMGGEGAHWLGQFPFSGDRHMFVNLGDGTYFHSGILAIRAAVAAKAPITYKILYNDAVAMTGGQTHDGPLDVPQLLAQLKAEGVERIVLLSERPQLYSPSDLPAGVPLKHRDELNETQDELAAFAGVSAIVFDQTCAAEKRRRRKKGAYENPDLRLFINPRVCEGCGDCSVQSNCISVEPLETEFGEKRRINQSSCNKDYSCLKGFCPSFVQVEGAEPRKAAGATFDIAALAAELTEPAIAIGDRPVNVLLTGIGGMGVTTTAAVLATAAHLDNMNASTLDMTGLAQKNGPVTSHVRLAARDVAIEGPRVPVGELDLLLGTDMIVAAGAEALSLSAPDRTRAILNADIAPTAEFVLHQTQSYNPYRLSRTIREAVAGADKANFARLAETVLGDAIFANMMLVGFAWQKGLIPVRLGAIEKAIRLNGAAADANIRAVAAGRLLAERKDLFDGLLEQPRKAADMSLDERIAFLAGELTAYQDASYAQRFLDRIAKVRAVEEEVLDGTGGDTAHKLTRTAAESLYRLMAYKDEYEVARLYSGPEFEAALRRQFEDGGKVSVQLAPPLLSRTDPRTGRPAKRTFGPWVFKLFSGLARLKGLRGTWADPFGYTAERREERALIAEYEATLEALTAGLTRKRLGLAVEIARVPDMIRGYGPVKAANIEKARLRHAGLMRQWTAPAGRETPSPVLEAAE